MNSHEYPCVFQHSSREDEKKYSTGSIFLGCRASITSLLSSLHHNRDVLVSALSQLLLVSLLMLLLQVLVFLVKALFIRNERVSERASA